MVLKFQVEVQNIIKLSLDFSNGFCGISINRIYHLDWPNVDVWGLDDLNYYPTKPKCEL
jgi:hypothetical protein